MTDKKRDRGSWFLVTKKGIEEFKTIRELKARLEVVKDGDMIGLIKGRRHEVKTQTVSEIAIV